MQRFKAILLIAVTTLLVALVIVPAAADYIGPHRTITTYETIYQRKACVFVDVRDPSGPGYCSCSMTIYQSPNDSCPGSVDSGYFGDSVCHWSTSGYGCSSVGDSISGPSSSIGSCSLGDLGCTAVVIEHQSTLPSANVSGSINCSAPGSNGWCAGPATLNITSSEPVSGKEILTIEGTRNGESFACPGDHCTNLPLAEGANAFSFWAISSYGDSSDMGSASANVDTQAPTISGGLSGTSGENGWYTTAVTLTASAVDPTPGSGIASFQVSTDGSAWSAFGGSLTLMDGTHTVALQTADSAGWTASTSQTIKVDTLAPQLSASLDGQTSGNNHYSAKVTLTASATDDPSGSGLNRIEYQDNNGAWTTYTTPITFYNGEHVVNLRAVDNAGLTSTVQSFDFTVDTSGPFIDVRERWQVSETVSLVVKSSQFPLHNVSVTFSDPQNRWPEITQSYDASGNTFSTQIHWDGKFNGSLAPSGTYAATIYAVDTVGNVSAVSPQITIPQVIPTQTVTPLTAAGRNTVTPAVTVTAESTAAATPQTTLSATGTAQPNGIAITSFSSPAGVPQPTPQLPSNVLWGAAAAAVIGAATAAALEAARKREEEEAAQKAAAEAAAAQFNAVESVIDAQIKAERAAQWQKEQEAERQKEQEEERQKQLQETAKEQEEEQKQEAANAALQAFRQVDNASMTDYENYFPKSGGATSATAASAPTQNKVGSTSKPADTWWNKALNWVDNHQVAVSIGIGIVAGIIVIATAGTAAPVLAVVLVGAAAAAGATAGGTVALNAYFNRGLTQNLIRNTLLAGGTALVVGAAPGAITETIDKFEPIVDIASKYLTGTPTSLFANTLFSPEIDLLSKALPAVLGTITSLATLAGLEAFNYGAAEKVDPTISIDERKKAETIGNIGSAVALGGMTITQAVGAIQKPAVESNDQAGAATENENTCINQEISEKPFSQVDIENDTPGTTTDKYAEAIKATKDIIKMNPKTAEDFDTPEMKELISIIGKNSLISVGNEQRLVTGKNIGWNDGYIGEAFNEGGIFYRTNPEVSRLVQTLPVDLQDALFERINRASLEPLLQQGIDIDTTLSGLTPSDLKQYVQDIKTINAGDFETARSSYKEGGYPFVLREAEWFKEFGYTGTYDEATKIFHWQIGN